LKVSLEGQPNINKKELFGLAVFFFFSGCADKGPHPSSPSPFLELVRGSGLGMDDTRTSNRKRTTEDGHRDWKRTSGKERKAA
jgi:hypothetical protein